MPEIVAPSPNLPIIGPDGIPTNEFYRWINQITNNDLLVGTGSPEGAIEATVGREYLDDAGTTGAVKFIKQLPDIAGDRTKGWVAI